MATPAQEQALESAQQVLSTLQQRHADHPLSIIRLSEPIYTTSNATNNRSSSGSAISDSDIANNASNSNPTPQSLKADLSHYRDLFTKLHFSYLEQVTKEKYLRAIVGDPPLLHTHQENVELEVEVMQMKGRLKEKKTEVDGMVEEMKSRGEGLVERWEVVRERMGRLEELEMSIREGEERIEGLRKEVQKREEENNLGGGEDGSQKLGLDDTREMIAKRQHEMGEMDQKIRALKTQLPGRMRECEVVERDLEALERRKNVAAAEAVEARRRREQGEHGGRDEVEERGRWYRSQAQVFRGLGLVDG